MSEEALQTLRRLNVNNVEVVQHQLSDQVKLKSQNPESTNNTIKQMNVQHDDGNGHKHGESCKHNHGNKGNKKGQHGHIHSHGGNKNYFIMIYTSFTILSCLYLETQHLNPFKGGHESQILSYLVSFNVFMCLWCYIQTYRIGNKVNKMSKIMQVDRVQNKIVDAKYILTSKNCQKCNFYKLPRVSHCSTCGHCIYKLDHHCMWTQTCIGHCNQRPFYLFCVYMCWGVLQFWYSTIRTGSTMIGGCNSSFFSHFEPGVYILWAITCVSAAVVGMMIIALAISHTLMILTNYTTLDSLKTKRMCPIPFWQYRPSYFDQKYINPFDRGQIQNIRSLFGTNLFTFWMPLGRQIENQFIVQPMNPQPTKNQLFMFTNLWQQEQNIQKQSQKMIRQLKTIYKGKKFILDGQQIQV